MPVHARIQKKGRQWLVRCGAIDKNGGATCSGGPDGFGTIERHKNPVDGTVTRLLDIWGSFERDATVPGNLWRKVRERRAYAAGASGKDTPYLPMKIVCPKCGTTNVLEANALGVTDWLAFQREGVA